MAKPVRDSNGRFIKREPVKPPIDNGGMRLSGKVMLGALGFGVALGLLLILLVWR